MAINNNIIIVYIWEYCQYSGEKIYVIFLMDANQSSINLVPPKLSQLRKWNSKLRWKYIIRDSNWLVVIGMRSAENGK